MRAKEFILKEDILNEADWNKVKSAILGGVLSLSALGAPNLQAKDIASMSGEEIKQYVIQNSQVKNKQEILDVINMLGQDRNREQPPIAQPTKNVTGVEINPISPTKSPVAKPPATATPVATPPVTPTAKSVTINPNAFSIKGLQFGMDLSQVVSILNPTVDDRRAVMDPKTFKYPQKMADNWGDAFKNFTVAGMYNWTPYSTNGEYLSYDTQGKLGAIHNDFNPNDFENIVQRFTQQYGTPQIYKSQVKNKLNYIDTNIIATWKVKGVTISIRKYWDTFTKGMILIASNEFIAARNKQDQEMSAKAAKDFE
jgi:hypothetical protein